MRFRPEQHLRRQCDIRAVREQGRRVECGAFTLWWRSRPPAVAPDFLSGVRVCVVASTAAVGDAVRRNRAKRRLREVFRLHQQRVAPSVDVMLVARFAATRVPFPELEQRFLAACQKIAPPPHA
ncbi:MAG: ribonuclease P protein component [Opitutae bacterium]|nr:ribonuclease P protein component [Opitutae bacterium]